MSQGDYFYCVVTAYRSHWPTVGGTFEEWGKGGGGQEHHGQSHKRLEARTPASAIYGLPGGGPSFDLLSSEKDLTELFPGIFILLVST